MSNPLTETRYYYCEYYYCQCLYGNILELIWNQTFISNCSLFSIQCPWMEGCLHHWMWSWFLQTQKCHLNPVCCSMMMSGGSHMDKGMGIVHVVRNVHECIKFYWKSPPFPNVCHQVVLFGSPLLLLLLGWHTGRMVAESVYVVLCWGGAARRWNLVCCSVIIILRKTVSQMSAYRSPVWFCGTSAMCCNRIWVKGCIFYTGDVVNLWASSKWGWVCWNFHYHFQSLCLLMITCSQMWHSGWSWSNWIIHHQAAGAVGAWIMNKRTHCKLVQWCYLACVPWGQVSKIVRLLLLHSIHNIL